MAEKRQVQKNLRRLRHVKTWQLLVLLVLFGFIAATLLRLNNVGMVQRREAVLAADQEGDVDAIQTRLYDLQRYVSAHINTSTGGFYLEGQYRRDSEARVKAASSVGNPNGNVNAKAAAVCDPQYTLYSQPYFQCFLRELAKYPSSDTLQTSVDLPSPENYRHSYAAPLLSFDFAGFAVILCMAIVALIFIRLIILLVLRFMLARYYRGA